MPRFREARKGERHLDGLLERDAGNVRDGEREGRHLGEDHAPSSESLWGDVALVDELERAEELEEAKPAHRRGELGHQGRAAHADLLAGQRHRSPLFVQSTSPRKKRFTLAPPSSK